ncbi:hypothetical protein BV22DRAFT_171057 [Leucogyrophana mollusca]|uniref:Uncharacterized protein n=1 Tax=Leucogyrophana mollusca TaxID=85980 RepID=A0ACB8BTV9_9AGAM|nr:hypothetical protein BV22DRAFT_171057 [Leucogyrophana mollusca]
MNTPPPSSSSPPPILPFSCSRSPSRRAIPSLEDSSEMNSSTHYASRIQPSRKYTLTRDDDPLDLLCRHFNVAKATLEPGTPLPSTLDLHVLRDAHMPSHILAVFDAPQSESDRSPSYSQPIIIIPVHADLYAREFRSSILPQSPPGTAFPVPHPDPSFPSRQVVTLPVIPTRVPHAPSVPLLLLFGLGLESRARILSCALLPPDVIGEFPSAPVMAQQMASMCTDDQLRSHVSFNQGLWKNILALGPRDTHFIGLVQTAWNATVEARRIRQRMSTTANGTTPPLLSPV